MTGAISDLAVAIVLGTAFGVGACFVLVATPRWGAVSLDRRIAPYVRDVADPRGASAWTAPVLPGAAALWVGIRTRLVALLGGAESVERRLSRAAWTMDVAAFRGRQLAWALAGVAAGAVGAVAIVLIGRFSPVLVLLPPVVGAAALLLYDVHLTRAAHLRTTRIQEELPTVLEFLALCLAAGEGLLDCLRRVGTVGVGELTGEIRAVVLAAGTGSSLAEALTGMARRMQVPALSRAVDHLVAAIERGAPLAQVLQAQAHDAREDAKRVLIEQAGRKEILMLIPLVFLVLPLSVIFAIFPGIFLLRLGLG